MEYYYKKDWWETKDHKEIKISDMETSHIENAIKFLKKRHNFYDEEYQLVCQRNYLSTKYIEHLEHQCKKQKEVIDKAIEYINDNLTISSILDGEKYYTINNYSSDYNDYKELLDILNEVSE